MDVPVSTVQCPLCSVQESRRGGELPRTRRREGGAPHWAAHCPQAHRLTDCDTRRLGQSSSSALTEPITQRERGLQQPGRTSARCQQHELFHTQADARERACLLLNISVLLRTTCVVSSRCRFRPMTADVPDAAPFSQCSSSGCLSSSCAAVCLPQLPYSFSLPVPFTSLGSASSLLSLRSTSSG